MGGVVQLSAWFPRGMDMREQRVECLPEKWLGSERTGVRGENNYEEMHGKVPSCALNVSMSAEAD